MRHNSTLKLKSATTLSDSAFIVSHKIYWRTLYVMVVFSVSSVFLSVVCLFVDYVLSSLIIFLIFLGLCLSCLVLMFSLLIFCCLKCLLVFVFSPPPGVLLSLINVSMIRVFACLFRVFPTSVYNLFACLLFFFLCIFCVIVIS